MKDNNCARLRIYLYGFYGEYSLKTIENILSSHRIPFTVIANLNYKQIQREISSCSANKILFTSAHPYIPRNIQNSTMHGTASYSIADLRNLTRWKKVYYFSHDAFEEFKKEELQFARDYDALFVRHPELIGREILGVPVYNFPKFPCSLPVELDYQFIFFISEWDYYRRCASPSELVEKFPILLSSSVGFKPPYVPDDSAYLNNLCELGVRVIPSDIRAEEIIPHFDGVVITNSTSGVISLGIEGRKRTIVLNDFSRTDSLVKVSSFIKKLEPPFDFKNVSSVSFDGFQWSSSSSQPERDEETISEFLKLILREC